MAPHAFVPDPAQPEADECLACGLPEAEPEHHGGAVITRPAPVAVVD